LTGPTQQKGEAAKKAAESDDLAKLGQARLDAAEKAYKLWFKDTTSERPFSITVYHLSVRWLDAERDLAKKKEERTAAYTRHLQRMNDWEKAYAALAPQRRSQMRPCLRFPLFMICLVRAGVKLEPPEFLSSIAAQRRKGYSARRLRGRSFPCRNAGYAWFPA
jgi:hypothetical protein